MATPSPKSGRPLFAGLMSAAETLLQLAALFQLPLPTLFLQNRLAAVAMVADDHARIAANEITFAMCLVFMRILLRRCLIGSLVPTFRLPQVRRGRFFDAAFASAAI